MRVMVSLNLADIMTATRPTTSQHVYEASNNEADSIDSSQESTSSERIANTAEMIE
jgi:hypothetical protein